MFVFYLYGTIVWASLIARSIKNLPAMQETWVQSLGREDPPGEGKGYALQCFCLRTPWTEEPGGLQSTGSQKVGHDLVTKEQQQ